MRRVIALVVLLLLGATPSSHARGASATAPQGTSNPTPVYGLPTSGEYAIVDAGSQAPDFSFESSAGARRLRDLRTQGHVLLLISPSDAQMIALENERAALLTLGVVPVTVLDQRPSACRALGARLRLGYPVVSDARRVIGAQFNSLDPSSRGDAPAWFVIDRSGRVRDLARQSWPERAWTATCAEALGLPAPDAPRSVSYPR